MDDKKSLRYVCLEGHANSFAMNKETNCIAVAGRSLLKIFSIEEDSLIEIHNMRKQPNLSSSSNAIAWSHIDSNILATAATNGCIAIWDLNKFGRQKQLNVYHDHERTTHAVAFHNVEANLLLSASQDSTLRLFDLREKSSCVSTFTNSESVRDVKFNPTNSNSFASVSENGCVQLWDLRKSDKFAQQFTAHSEPIYCLDFHPNQPWLATGSRDRSIKIWNMSTSKPTLEYTIYTIAVVGRVRWRPERKFHIASCALVVDYSIYLWDVRRSFIPYASFSEHTNVTTDIAFKGVPDVLISTSKDSTIYKHNTKNAHHLAQAANPQSTSINPRGEILFVCKAKVKQQPQMTTSTSSLKLGQIIPAVKKMLPSDTVDSITPSGRIVNGLDQFHMSRSTVHFFADNEETNFFSRIDDVALTKTLHKDYQFFTKCAEEYKLKASTMAEFLENLEHNANVARRHGRPNVSMLWSLVKNVMNKTMVNSQKQTINLLTTQSSNQSSGALNGIGNQIGLNVNGNFLIEKGGSRENISSANEETFNDSNEIVPTTNWQNPRTADFEVEVFDEKVAPSPIDSLKNLRNGFLFTGPHDNLIKEFPMCSSSLLNHELMHYRNSQAEQEFVENTPPPPDTHSFLSIRFNEMDFLQHWKPFQVLADSLVLQSEIGDLQTPCCILLCLNSISLDGKSLREELPISLQVQENFLQAYVDMLFRHQLLNVAAEIINLTKNWLPIVAEMNEQSTTIHTACGECGRVMPKNGYCKHCRSFESSRCAICLEIVKGIFSFCHSCGHGGHLEHIVGWFSQNPRCPKCNHLCEYD